MQTWTKTRSGTFRTALLTMTIAIVGALLALLAQPEVAEAHCDAVGGPVVQAAQQALDRNDVRLVLPYVKPDQEAELTAAFTQAQSVRALGGEAGALADRYFFETAVRLHRIGEGAAYTGLKEETEFGPALEAAEQALTTGSLDEVYTVLDQALRTGVEEKYHAVVAAREHEARKGTVEASRERAEAELMFEKYVYELHQSALGLSAHTEGGAAAHVEGKQRWSRRASNSPILGVSSR